MLCKTAPTLLTRSEHDGRTDGETDRQTDRRTADRFIDPAPVA